MTDKRLHNSISAQWFRCFTVASLLALPWIQLCAQPALSETEIIQSLKAPKSLTRSFAIERTAPDGTDPQPPGTVQPPPPGTNGMAPELTAPTSKPQVSLVIQFALNSADIQASSFAQLDTLATAMRSPELVDLSFDIEGHTDATGPVSVNMRLSERRAKAVSAYLHARGIASERLHAIGLGPTQPLPQLSPQSPLHRRVVIATRL